ncbi:MAG: hypothetical protein ACRDQ1_16105, partial [Sciscionella sp.]
ERATNPPLWRKVLRSPWLYRALVLVALIVGATVAYHHFFPGDTPAGQNQAARPGSKPERQAKEGVGGPKDAVADIYRFAAQASSASDPADAMTFAKHACFIFTDRAAAQFADARQARSCTSAMRSIAPSKPDSYGAVDLRGLPEPPSNRSVVTIDSCSFAVSGGPRLGVFTMTAQPGGTWLISHYAKGPESCPAPPS